MSPIAFASARAAQTRPDVKGSGRRVNSTNRDPSVAELLARAPSIEDLAELRRRIFIVHKAGALDARSSTLREWEERLWVRVLELMRDDPRNAPYVYNVTLRWSKPEGLARGLWLQLLALTRDLPSDAELLRRQGITIEGVTS